MIAAKGKIKGYLMVRDANGMPKIDKPLETPDEIWDTLSTIEKDFANARVAKVLRRLTI